jgi:hypothetical protein
MVSCTMIRMKSLSEICTRAVQDSEARVQSFASANQFCQQSLHGRRAWPVAAEVYASLEYLEKRNTGSMTQCDWNMRLEHLATGYTRLQPRVSLFLYRAVARV